MKKVFTILILIGLMFTLVQPVTAAGSKPAPPQAHAYGKTLAEWQLLYFTWYLGGIQADHVGNVRFMPLPQGEVNGEDPLIVTGQMDVTWQQGMPFVLPIFTWVGERYADNTEDARLAPEVFKNLTVQIILDGQPLMDSGRDDMGRYYFDVSFDPPILFQGRQFIWSQGIGFVYPSLAVGEHTLKLYAVSDNFPPFGVGLGYDNTWHITVQPQAGKVSAAEVDAQEMKAALNHTLYLPGIALAAK